MSKRDNPSYRALKEVVSNKRFADLVIDMHCHPAMKPHGKSYASKSTRGKNSAAIGRKNSVWHYDPPTILDKLFNYLPPNLTKFSQADFTSLSRGGVNVISASLYPLEKGFIQSKLDKIPFDWEDHLADLALGISTERIAYLKDQQGYFRDLQEEYDFYLQMHGKKVKLPHGEFSYKLVRNYAEIEKHLFDEPQTISVVVSIEGAHSFDTGLRNYVKGWRFLKKRTFDHLDTVKNWEYRPFFITIAHHFDNDLCGHARSLSGTVGSLADQKDRLDEGFTSTGLEFVDKMLDKTTGRILVDIKHMSVKSRKDYFDHLESNYGSENIPILVSHGAANGMHSPENPQPVFMNTAPQLSAMDINFFDTELVKIGKSNGLFCLQLDERRIASRAALRQASMRVSRRKILFHRSKLVWNNIRHIAEVLDHAGLFPWGITAIGSDFDGIINPLNGFWTEEDMDYLDNALLMHAYNYLSDVACPITVRHRIDPEEIVSRVMGDNAHTFMMRNFI